MNFGEKLKKLRNEKGLSKKELADKAEISMAQIINIELHQNKPSAVTIYKLATALGIDYDELYDED